MDQALMKEKVETLLKDKEFCDKFFALESAEEMSKELEKHDLDVSPEELRQIGTLLRKKEDGELSDEELEEVAGGSLFYLVIGIVGAVFATGGIIAGNLKAAGKC